MNKSIQIDQLANDIQVMSDIRTGTMYVYTRYIYIYIYTLKYICCDA